MERSAANAKADKSQKADSSKDSALRIRPVGDKGNELGEPLRGLVPSRGCRDSACSPSMESVGQRMAVLPAAQRRQAAMALQRSRGNRFVQRMVIQTKLPRDGSERQQAQNIAPKSGSPVVQRYVKVGLYEGSLGMDHIGVGVNSEKTKGFSPKAGQGREAEKGSWVEGEVKDDDDLIDSMTIKTSPRQEARLQEALNRSESSSHKFHLYQHNCAQHGAELLNSAGLSVKGSFQPRAFLEGLKRQFGLGQEAGEQPMQGKFESHAGAAEPVRSEPNRTGMPDRLKAGIESLSGIDMSDVRVHANSDRPARLNALAYTQGNQIYLGPGQERHLPHEAWHAVQQKEGRVRATGQMNGRGINDAPSFEHEAEAMGEKAAQSILAPDEKSMHGKFGEGAAQNAEGVKVHCNSAKPAMLNPLAIARGTDIHMFPEQEKYLPHEAWHAVQQMHSMREGSVYQAIKGLALTIITKNQYTRVASRTQDESIPKMTYRPSTAISMTGDLDGKPLVQCQMQALVYVSPLLAQQQGMLERAHAASRMMVKRQSLQDSSSAARGSIVQRIPVAVPVEPFDEFIYHITTLENFHLIVAIGGLLPINWIIEGTHGLRRNPNATALGLDALRGQSKYESLEDHARLFQAAEKAWKEGQGTSLEKSLALIFADIKLGRKSDFVYGTTLPSTLASYQWHYLEDPKVKLKPEDLVVLRWRKLQEDYFKDFQDDAAIKTLEKIDLSRLEVARGESIKEDTNTAAKSYLESLTWKRADNRTGLIEAGLLPSGPVAVANKEVLTPTEHGEAVEAVARIRLQEVNSERIAGSLQMRSSAQGSNIIQYMKEGAREAMEVLLEDQLELNGEVSHKVAKNLDKLTDLKDLDPAQIMKLAKKVKAESRLKNDLIDQLNTGIEQFSKAILANITSEQKPEHDKPHVDFESLIRSAISIHAPAIGAKIDEAQERSRKSGKKLLVIVGEMHDDLYGRVMVTALVGAMRRIFVHNLYLEATPDAVRKHVESYESKGVGQSKEDYEIKARAYFFRSLYNLRTNIKGVDILEETAEQEGKEQQINREIEQLKQKKQQMEQMEQMEQIEAEIAKLRSQLNELNVVAKNIRMARALASQPESGVLLVGLAHLPGLASDPEIKRAYEIVTITAVHTKELATRDILSFGRLQSYSEGIKSVPGLYIGGSDMEIGEVDLIEAFELAQQIALELEKRGTRKEIIH